MESVLALLSIFRGEKKVPEDLSEPGKFCRDFVTDKYARYDTYREKRYMQMEALHPSTGLWMWRQVFEKCLGLSEGGAWSVMPGFEEGILRSVNDSFDRDTAGAVAGALLGAYWGESGIPERWKRGVEKADEIVELANELI